MKNILFIFFLLIELKLSAQDPASSQFFSNPLYLNPAFAGIRYDARLGADYRNQWNAIPGKFVTYNAWADIFNPFLKGGFGLLALQDVSGEGALKTTSFGIIQSFEEFIPHIIRFRAGYNVTVTNKRIDWSKLVFSDQLDAVQGQVNSTSAPIGNSDGKTFVDFSAGGMIDVPAYKKIHNVIITATIGYSANHLTQPNDALSGSEYGVLPRKHTVHGTLTIEFLNYIKDKKPFYISPNVIYEKQAKFTTTNVGFYAMRKPMIAGLFYRKRTFTSFKDQDSFILFVGLCHDIKKNRIFRMGYSYDFTINHLATNTMGSHEISLSMEFMNKKLFAKNARIKKRNKRAVECTDFGDRSFIF